MDKKCLNLCAGGEIFVNCDTADIDPAFNTTHCFDIKIFPWPLERESYDEVYLFHAIEHIEKKHHQDILQEIVRILRPNGLFIVSFPEFEIIVRNWLENEGGLRNFWENTVFGLQRTPSDYHYCAMSTEEMIGLMLKVGFTNISIRPEDKDKFNTIMKANRCEILYENTYEKVLYDEVIA